jgi:hypothetical protein
VVILRFAQDDSATSRRDEWEKGGPTLSTERGKGGAPLKFWGVPVLPQLEMEKAFVR